MERPTKRLRIQSPEEETDSEATIEYRCQTPPPSPLAVDQQSVAEEEEEEVEEAPRSELSYEEPDSLDLSVRSTPSPLSRDEVFISSSLSPPSSPLRFRALREPYEVDLVSD